jgi:hypothetical protein
MDWTKTASLWIYFVECLQKTLYNVLARVKFLLIRF